MGNGFDAVRSELGEFAGPDLVRAVDELALDQLDSLAESILNLPRSEALPDYRTDRRARSPGERP